MYLVAGAIVASVGEELAALLSVALEGALAGVGRHRPAHLRRPDAASAEETGKLEQA